MNDDRWSLGRETGESRGGRSPYARRFSFRPTNASTAVAMAKFHDRIGKGRNRDDDRRREHADEDLFVAITARNEDDLVPSGLKTLVSSPTN